MKIEENQPDENSESVIEQKQENEIEQESSEGANQEEVAADDGSPESGEEEVLLIGDEEQEEVQEAPAWVKEVRKKNRDLIKENKKLKKELSSSSDPEHIVLGEKPTLESCDYDSEVYEKNYSDWIDKKTKIENRKADSEKKKKAEEQEFNQKLEKFKESRSKLTFKDVDEAEEIVTSIFNQNQIGTIVQYSENPALVLYALGKKLPKS